MNTSMDSITLKNNIPVLSHTCIELLTEFEVKLSKFFKCFSIDSNGLQCFWSGNNGKQFKQHLLDSHQRVKCFYCQLDGQHNTCAHNESADWFDAQQYDQLMDHLIQSHGRREFQCNRCHYRANTCTHIELHQITAHNHIWSNNNSIISYESLKSLNDANKDICKIIKCKPISFGPTVDHSVLIPRFCPNLDLDLEENKWFCLFCDYSDSEDINVFMHCVQRHRDLVVCGYERECESTYTYDTINGKPTVISDDSEDEITELSNNTSKPFTQSFKTQCTLDCRPEIPGLEEDVRPKSYNNRPNNKRFNKKRPTNRRSNSFDANFYDDGFEDECVVPQSEPNVLPKEKYRKPIAFPPHIKKQFSTPTPVFGSNIGNYRKPIPTPNASNFSQRIPSNSTQRMPFYKKPKLQNKSVNQTGGYRQWKENKLKNAELNASKNQNQTSTATTSATPLSGQMPPEIDLQPIESELGLESEDSNHFRNNAFKQIKRVGVSKEKPNNKSKSQAITYIRREEEERDEYLELLNETPIPKRGIKARFESQNHFELTALQRTDSKLNTNNTFKCLICADEQKIRENNIKFHLKTVHSTDSSLKCGFCNFIGLANAIKDHSKVSHPNSEPKIEKFIVNSAQNSAIGFTSTSRLIKQKTTARKSTTATTGLVSKGGKGALTQRIKESTFLGPLRNDRTDKKRTLESESEQPLQPFQRVHPNRTTHSSNIRSKKRPKIIESDSESDVEMHSEVDSEPDVNMGSDVGVESEPIRTTRRPLVAKKSTAKASSEPQSDTQITLTAAQIPTKFFCVLCNDGLIINYKADAIEHYKKHLGLLYTCTKCGFQCVGYDSMQGHFKDVHKSDSVECESNSTPVIQNWILMFLDNQIKFSDFAADSVLPDGTGIVCPICVKASRVFTGGEVRARAFDALWKVKLHVCKHLHWCPMKCNHELCANSEFMFPNNPYLLMKHLIDSHYTSCENLYNMSFRGQKPFNDMKREQLRLIDRNFTSISVGTSSDILNAFFSQLMEQLDLIYENHLKTKFNLTKEIRINVNRLVQIKTEPTDESQEPKPEVKAEDKKDIKFIIKSEFKSEVKDEIKSEIKNETKNEPKEEPKAEETPRSLSPNYWNRLYADTTQPNTSANNGCNVSVLIVLSSDDEN